MKRCFSVLLIIAMLVVLSASVSATDDGTRLLSTLTDEECIAFLKESGVEIPTILEDDVSWALFARMIIEKVEEDPEVQFPYSYSVISKFANDIKNAVNEYYGLGSQSTFDFIQSEDDVLQDSVLYGTRYSSYSLYNCYEYAIDTYTLEESGWLDPGLLTWESLGNNTSDYYYNCYANVNTISSWVASDLEALGCTINSRTPTIPDVVVSDHTNLICVRKDADGIPWYYDNEGVLHYFHDYHFMKMLMDGNWYHKPGATNLLRYKYIPSNEVAWLCEGYDGSEGLYFYDDAVTYESDIYFIAYTTPHEWEYVYCNSSQHIKTCTICGETNGSVSACIYINNTCKFCGNYNGYIQLTPSKRTVTAVAVTE